MSIRQCPNHHFYDSDKYAVCPICLLGNSAADPDSDRTIGYADILDPLTDKTVCYSFLERSEPSKPVVGWLVSIKGPTIGQDWRLHEGRNDIGTAADSEVILGSSPNRKLWYASVIYDAKHQCFLLMPGSASLLYLNGELLSQTLPLEDGALIGIEDHLLCFQKFHGSYGEPLG